MEQSEANWSRLRWLSARRLVFALLIISSAGGGCTSVWVQERRLAPTGLAPQDAIAVIVTAPIKDEHLSALENQVAGCVQSALSDSQPGIRIISPNEFRKVAFPNLTMDQIPSGYFAWQSLLRDPAFHSTIAPLGLRYVLAVDTEEGRRLNDVAWTAATTVLGGPGPSVSLSWDREVLLEAVVVDARHRRIAGAVHAYAKGNSGAGVSLVIFPTPFLLPYGMPSFPFGVACQGLGERLAKFLADENGQAAQTVETQPD